MELMSFQINTSGTFDEEHFLAHLIIAFGCTIIQDLGEEWK
jgi:hypothetical protein